MKLNVLVALIALLVVAACTKIEKIGANDDIQDAQKDLIVPQETTQQAYDPKINPADFTTKIDNKYLALTPGKKMIYQGQTEDGLERVEYYVTNETKMVMGVKTLIVWDRVWLDGDLIEDTKDWFAQDKEGNVWYFGEESYEMLNGEVLNNEGSWEAGVNGAKPGIVMKANPKVGESYFQEYLKGEAEDKGDVLSLTESVKVPYGSFSNCLKTRDWTALDLGADEHKYYCTPAGGVVLEVGLEDGERVELLSVEYNVKPTIELPKITTIPDIEDNDITAEEAREIALNEVPGKVTGIAKERKFSKICYVVEVDATNGPETDVIIEIATGKVLGVEE